MGTCSYCGTPFPRTRKTRKYCTNRCKTNACLDKKPRLRAAEVEAIHDILHSDFILTVRAKGAPERLVVMKHALRNAMLPVVTVIGLNTGLLFSGAVLTETVFARPGIGRLLVDSFIANDYPIVQGVILLIGTFYVVINLVVDVAYAYLDPRIKYGSQA